MSVAWLAMMGPTQTTEPKLFHYGVNLEKRVRPNNPLRQIKQVVDFGFVRPAVAQFYGRDGHESVDPIVTVKLMLLLFLDDVASERELMRIVGERLDYMWFLGFDLDDEIPNHSVLSKARKHWGSEVYRELFVQAVISCVHAGLIDGGKIHMDGSLINANASRESVKTGPPELIEALRKAYRREEAKLEDDSDHDDAPTRVGAQRPLSMVSKTDPDAAVVRKGKGDVSRPRYKNHRAIDNQCGVITGICTTAGNVGEDDKMMELVNQHEQNTGSRVATAVADTQYGTNNNFAACQQRGIRSHMADLGAVYTNSGSRKGIFKEEEFRYNPETDSYICPAGNQLHRAKNLDRQYVLYRGNRKICSDCALRAQCTRSKHWRTIKRHIHHEQIQQARMESKSGWAKRDRKRRRHLMEGSFADAASNHGFKRARWRGLEKQTIQDLIIASCQNLRILLRHGYQKKAAAMAVAVPVQQSVDRVVAFFVPAEVLQSEALPLRRMLRLKANALPTVVRSHTDL